MPFNDSGKNLMLDALDEGATPPGITHVGVHQITNDPGTSTNANSGEPTVGTAGYARQSVQWVAATGGQKANSNALTFDVPAGTYGYFTLWNNATANSGNYRGYIPFGGSTSLKGFFSVDTDLSTDTLFAVAHGMSDGDRVILFNVFSEALPTGTGLTEGALLYVVASSADSFKVSTTSGGSPIDITAKGGGEGYWQRIVPESFGAPGQITVAAGALVLDATAI
jgi:hypothetical protein